MDIRKYTKKSKKKISLKIEKPMHQKTETSRKKKTIGANGVMLKSTLGLTNRLAISMLGFC
jgi:hypothetical protein